MRKTFYLLLPLAALSLMGTSCKMAPNDNPGDTVAAKVFAPIDSAALHRRQAAKAKTAADSTDIFYLGQGSNKQHIQLISYPSRRDTLLLARTRHMKRKGSITVDQAVRVTFLVQGSDTLVAAMQSLETNPAH